MKYPDTKCEKHVPIVRYNVLIPDTITQMWLLYIRELGLGLLERNPLGLLMSLVCGR